MTWIREKLQGWKTILACVSAIAGSWTAHGNGVITLDAAITATVISILGLTLGAKFDRAAGK